MMQVSFEQIKRAADRGRPQAQQMLTRIQERAKTEGISDEEAFKKLQAMVNQPAGRARGGLNENYARELMELHTLGVDGGYTQKDVTEVARCLTGWGVKGGRYSGEFEFHPRLHDSGEKVVLGKVIAAGGGIEDGQAVLEMLVSHPSTMRHISTKLCRRFVSDDPPKSLVDKCVETWKRTDGDIRSIVETIVTSPEFFSPAAYRSKIKSPFEYVVSAVRATGGAVLTQPQAPALGRARQVGLGINVFAKDGAGQVNQRVLAGQIGTLGQPLYNYGFPTGYPEDSSKWVSAGALIGRINFALNLTAGKLADVDLSRSFLNDTSGEHRPVPVQIDAVARQILGAEVSVATRATLVKQLQPDETAADSASTPMSDSRRIASLLLGSPEFQRR